jgi:Arc/MetJ family transcription regulator
MLVNIRLDRELLDKAQNAVGLTIERGLVEYALRELIRRARLPKLLSLKGKVNWEGDLPPSLDK